MYKFDLVSGIKCLFFMLSKSKVYVLQGRLVRLDSPVSKLRLDEGTQEENYSQESVVNSVIL